ncbi:MAG: arylesterase [Proteobacteria bacterium]|nr:MAG: arylesterase [Pseudomonadota bacterium]
MRVTQPVYVFICLLAVTLILNSGEILADQPDTTEREGKPTVLIWGDSLSAAYGIPVESGWVSLLQAKYQDELSIVNGSISGETTQGGLTRLPDALKRHNPRLLVLGLGANDGLRGIKLVVMQENLQAMIDLARKQDIAVVLIGIRIPLNYGFAYTRKFEQVYVDLAESNKLPLLPFLLEGVALDYDLMQADGLHPTAAAQPTVLAHVMTVLAPAISAILEKAKPAPVSVDAAD